MLHSGSSPALPFTYLLRLPARGRSIFGKYLCAFKIYGIWPQPYTRVLQCSPTCVGLAQARPQKSTAFYTLLAAAKKLMKSKPCPSWHSVQASFSCGFMPSGN